MGKLNAMKIIDDLKYKSECLLMEREILLIRKKQWLEVSKKREQRMACTNGLDLRTTLLRRKENFFSVAICDENGHIFQNNILIDCTDLDNPSEYFTGILLTTSNGIYMKSYGIDYSGKPTSIFLDIKKEYCLDYHKYKESKLLKIDNIDSLKENFANCETDEGLESYKSNFRSWANEVYYRHLAAHNEQNDDIKNSQKIIEYRKNK